MDAGHSLAASEIYRKGLKANRNDPSAVQWLTFNLMQSDSAALGPRAAQQYVATILSSGINWPAKLYTLELALAAATEGDDNIGILYNQTLECVQTLISSDLTPSDINVMSCHTIARHVLRLAGDGHPDPLFHSTPSEDDSPVVASLPLQATPPGPVHNCNRLPTSIVITQEIFRQPLRPVSIRSCGESYLIRLGENTIVYDKRGRVLDTPYGPLPAFLRIVLEKLFHKLPESQRIRGRSLFFGDYFSQALNYCHWVVDNLPRLVVASKLEFDFVHAIGAFVLQAPFQQETLARLLSPHQDYLAFGQDDGLVGIDELYYVDNASIAHFDHPLLGCDLSVMSDLVAALMGNKSPDRRRRLYVPRRHSRRVLNPDAIEPLLRQYGFETIDTDTMSFAAQVEAFSEAEAVVAPHGAALTNMLFAPATSKLVEFFPAFGGSSSFYRLVTARGQSYSCYIDDHSHGGHRDQAGTLVSNTTGMWVDPSWLDQWLKTNLE